MGFSLSSGRCCSCRQLSLIQIFPFLSSATAVASVQEFKAGFPRMHAQNAILVLFWAMHKSVQDTYTFLYIEN